MARQEVLHGLERLFGLDEKPEFDALLREEEFADEAIAIAPLDFSVALRAERMIAAARSYRAMNNIPDGMGFRAEMLKIAGKVFSNLSLRSVRGAGKKIAFFLQHGAVSDEKSESVDILISGENVPPAAATLAFSFGGELGRARYVFLKDDIERAVRMELKRRYPGSIASDFARIAENVEMGMRSNPSIEELAERIEGVWKEAAAPGDSIRDATRLAAAIAGRGSPCHLARLAEILAGGGM